MRLRRSVVLAPGFVYARGTEKGAAMVVRIASHLVLLLAVSGVVTAQGTWSERTRAGEWAFSRGDQVRAEEEFKAALDLAMLYPEGDPRLEISMANLARLYEHEMRMEEAQPLYQLLLAAREFRLGDSHEGLLDPLVAVARTSVQIGDVPTAEASLERYREIADASGAADPAQHWRALALYARMLNIREESEAALSLQRSAVAVQASDPGATDMERASELESLAQMELLYGDVTGVVELLEEVIELRRGDGPGGDADVLSEAASTAVGAGHTELAEELATRAMEGVEEGATPPVTAQRVLADVSWMEVRRGSDRLADLTAVEAEAVELDSAALRHEDLLQIQNDTLAVTDPERVETLRRLAAIETMRGDLAEAAVWQRQYADAVSAAGGDTAVLAADGLAFLLTEDGRWSEALTVNSRLLEQLEASWGDSDPRLAPVLERQMLLLTELGRKKEAKAFRKRLAKLRS